MKLVIDINEELYEQAIRDKNYHDVTGLNDINDYSLTIAQGIPYEERPQGEWIPVSKCWPAFSGLYLVSIDDLVTVANFTGAYFINKRGLILNVSAWQPLPEPYKEGGAE